VLLVDDEEAVRRMLTEHLVEAGYEIIPAENGREALEKLHECPVDLVVADIRMPEMGGFELLQQVVAQHPPVGFVMLTACQDVPTAVRAMKAGALDYIVKPFQLEEVSASLARALEVHSESLKSRQHLLDLEAVVNDQARQLRSTLGQLRHAWEDIFDALVAALDAREHEPHSHSKRVSEYAVHLAGAMGIASELEEVIRRGAMLHDIGKIGVPDSVLLKPGKLSGREWVEMRKHPQIGYWILDGIEALKPACEIVLTHHEHFDGSGYPARLKGDVIPIGARVFSVVDCLDAMTSDRPYRKAVSYEQARREIEESCGAQFDPEVVRSFGQVPPSVWGAIREQTAQCEAGPASIFARLFRIH
jgi:putative two-component system response regulator